MAEALLEATGVTVRYKIGRGVLTALDGADITVAPAETVALVGESGSGKSTLAGALIRMIRPDAGSIRFLGAEVAQAPERDLGDLRRGMQMVFQDPYGSLDPRWSVGRIVAEPLAAQGRGGRAERAARAASLLAEVGLSEDAARRRPAAFSGGQRQRIAIARALAPEPRLLIADEPVSALDVSVAAQIMALFARLRAERGIAILLVAHDLALVASSADRVAVMYLGRIVEEGPAAATIAQPLHPYTAALVAAAPSFKRGGRTPIVLAGEPPSPLDPPPGCPFHPRCPAARPDCADARPPLVEIAPGRRAACFYPGSLA